MIKVTVTVNYRNEHGQDCEDEYEDEVTSLDVALTNLKEEYPEATSAVFVFSL